MWATFGFQDCLACGVQTRVEFGLESGVACACSALLPPLHYVGSFMGVWVWRRRLVVHELIPLGWFEAMLLELGGGLRSFSDGWRRFLAASSMKPGDQMKKIGTHCQRFQSGGHGNGGVRTAVYVYSNPPRACQSPGRGRSGLRPSLPHAHLETGQYKNSLCLEAAQ